METYLIALGVYIALSVGATKLIREEDDAEMFAQYGLKTRYQRVKDFLCRLF